VNKSGLGEEEREIELGVVVAVVLLTEIPERFQKGGKEEISFIFFIYFLFISNETHWPKWW